MSISTGAPSMIFTSSRWMTGVIRSPATAVSQQKGRLESSTAVIIRISMKMQSTLHH